MVFYQPKQQENYEKAAYTACNLTIFKAKYKNPYRPVEKRSFDFSLNYP